MELPVIDDFSDGEYNVSLTSGNLIDVQRGNCIGGRRQTYLEIVRSEYGQQPGATLDIRNGHLILDTGVRVHRGLQIGYGYDHTEPGRYFHLNLDLRPYSRFIINFLFSEGIQTDGLSMQVSSAAGMPGERERRPRGVTYQAGISSLPIGLDSDLAVVELKFTGFQSNTEPLNLFDAVSQGIKIDTLLFLFAGKPVGASNFAIDSIKCA